MNLQALQESLIKHEGIKLTMYTCPAGFPTLAVGHRLDRPISSRAAMQILSDDIQECVDDLDRAFPIWRSLSDARQNVLAEMVFNIGLTKLSKFTKMWTAIKSQDFDKAAKEMESSAWAKQVGRRAITLAEAMRNG